MSCCKSLKRKGKNGMLLGVGMQFDLLRALLLAAALFGF